MGCTASVPSFPPDESSVEFGPPIPIPVNIGSGCRHNLNHDVIIVFIFGGPASQKGKIIEELTRSFNFMSIAVEDIVFNYMPSRVGNTVDTIGEIQDALRKDNGLLTIDWILSMISGKLATSMNQRFVIDIVPTLSSIMKAESYRARSHERSMESFERKHPIAFALEISVADEQALLKPKKGDGVADRNESNRNLSPELNQFMRGIDDIDKGRLEKRLEEYHSCSMPFLRYFEKSRRIAKLSVNADAFSNLVPTLRSTMLDFGFTLTRREDYVIVFSTETTHENIDVNYYKLKVLDSSELSRASDDLSAQIIAVNKYITSHSRHDDNYLVLIPSFFKPPKSEENKDAKKANGVKLRSIIKYDETEPGPLKEGSKSDEKKRINFVEKKEQVYLDEFIRNKRHDKQPLSRSRVAVNCITSTRQTFLFLEPFPQVLAQSISLIYNKNKDNPPSSKNNDK